MTAFAALRMSSRRTAAKFSSHSILVAVVICCGGAVSAQAQEPEGRAWDISGWAAGATGEESTNFLTESQILSAGVFVGKVLTGELGTGWRRGRLELGFDFAPVFVQFTPQRIHGVTFDPLILRWNSGVRRGRISPYLELGGGAVHTNQNFPVGDTSTFNFIARGGGGILIATRRAQAFEVGCRWWHISNANLGRAIPSSIGFR